MPDPRRAASVAAVVVALAFADGLVVEHSWSLATVQGACVVAGAVCVSLVVRTLRRRRGNHKA